MTSNSADTITTPPATPNAESAQSWVDIVCTGRCGELLKSHPTIYTWRSAIVVYVALFVLISVVMLYKSITRRIAASPEAPLASKTEEEAEKVETEVLPAKPTAPLSPKARVAKRAAPVVSDTESEPIVLPKVVRGRKSTSPKSVTEPEAKQPSTRRASMAPKSPRGRSKAAKAVEAPTSVAESRPRRNKPM